MALGMNADVWVCSVGFIGGQVQVTFATRPLTTAQENKLKDAVQKRLGQAAKEVHEFGVRRLIFLITLPGDTLRPEDVLGRPQEVIRDRPREGAQPVLFQKHQDHSCNISEVVGPYAWGNLHHAAESFPCPPCAEEGASLLRMAHDLVNHKLGKPLQYAEDFRRWHPVMEQVEAQLMSSIRQPDWVDQLVRHSLAHRNDDIPWGPVPDFIIGEEDDPKDDPLEQAIERLVRTALVEEG